MERGEGWRGGGGWGFCHVVGVHDSYECKAEYGEERQYEGEDGGEVILQVGGVRHLLLAHRLNAKCS
jgi:hypothetical protein